MLTTNQILEIVRERCGLKKLEKDCVVKEVKYRLKISGEPEKISEREYTIFDINYRFDGERYHTNGYVYIENKITYPSIKDRMFGECAFVDHNDTKYEIIGLPVQLNHLLIAIEKAGGDIQVYCDGSGWLFKNDVDDMPTCIQIDLSKTVEQNLNQNPELLKLVGELLINEK